MGKIQRKKEKPTNKRNKFQEFVDKMSPAAKNAAIIAICVVVAAVCCLIEGCGVFRAIDYYTEDTLFQNKRSTDRDIVIIGLTDDDYDSMAGSYSYSDPEFIGEIIKVLNSLPVAPAVIGVDEMVMSTSELKACAENIFADNVVLSYYTQLDDGLVISENSQAADILVSNSLVCNSFDGITTGHSNILYDSDGIARRAINDIQGPQGNVGSSFAYQCYLKYCEAKGIEANGAGNLIKNNISLISFASAPGDYFYCSISDLFNGNFVSADFANKIVLVGPYTNNIRNGYHTAVDRDGSMFNVEYQANIIENLKNDCLMSELNLWIQLACLFIVILIFTLILAKRKMFWGFMAFIAILVLDIIFSIICFSSFLAVHPLFYIISLPCLVFVLIFKLHRTTVENATVVSTMNRYMDPTVFDNIVRDSEIPNHEIKGNAVVIFVDIRGFTEIITKNDKSTVAALLDKYYEITYNCITMYGGVIDKYIGDGVMGYWLDKENAGAEIVERACLAALKIRSELIENGNLFTDYIGKPIKVGMGLDYGEILFGNVGGSSRMDYTIVGSTVTRASKIESLAGGGMIYISDTMVNLLGDYASVEPLSVQQAFKGFDSAFQIYSLNSMRRAIWNDNEKTLVKSENKVNLYILGARGSRPVEGIDYSEFGGQTSCYIIKNGSHALVIDCGTGLYDAGPILANCTRIDVCITHIHYDHILGLLDWSVFPCDAEVTFYADFGHYYGLKTFDRFFEAPFWPVVPKLGQFVDIDKKPGVIPLGDDMSVKFFPADHPNNAHLMIIQVLDKKVVVLADCETTVGIPISSMQFSDCIIFDGMFTDEEYGNTIGWGHSTWENGCKLGAIAKPKTLIISHHDSHRSDKNLRDFERKSKKVYPNTVFARSGQIINL